MRSTAACQASGPVDDSGGLSPFSSMITRETSVDCAGRGAGADVGACGDTAAVADCVGTCGNPGIEGVCCEFPRKMTSNCFVRAVYSVILLWIVPAILELLSPIY